MTLAARLDVAAMINIHIPAGNRTLAIQLAPGSFID
jgi:hypothetical protein